MKELLQKKSVKIALLLIVLLVVIGIVGINVRSAQRGKDYDTHMDAAEKYLTELDYEQAIAEYTMAFEIDPKEEVVDALEQTYLDYAKAYADTGDYEKAVGILEEGYAVTERESLKEQIEEYAAQQEIKEQEEELKQLVESEEFHKQVTALTQTFYGSQYITDEQVKELCRSMIEILERYRELYPENHYYYYHLQGLYCLVGKYELCVQIRAELHERYPDNVNYSSYRKGDNSETIYDEYGRIIKSTGFYQGGKEVHEFEYGKNGKMIRETIVNDGGRRNGEVVINTSVWEYEYDSEGRLSKTTIISEGWSSIITERVYEYSEGGCTIYENSEINSDDFHQVDRRTTNFVMNEYGEIEMVGDVFEVIQ